MVPGRGVYKDVTQTSSESLLETYVSLQFLIMRIYGVYIADLTVLLRALRPESIAYW